MAIKAAEIQVVIGADTNPAMRGIRNAMGAIGKSASTALGVFTGQLLFNAMQQVGQAFVGLGRDAMQSTISWEQLRFSLESLAANELRAADSTLSMADALNAAKEKAGDTLKWLQDLAIISPFPTETVAQVFQMQMRMGQTSEQAKVLTESLLNMGAATGLSGENLYSAGLALSQIAGSAKLSAQDLRQLINAGIPVNEILTEMGLSWEELSESSVAGQEFVQAFIGKANEYAGSVDRMQGSWTAMLGALQDAKSIGLRELFAGIFDALQPVVAKFTEWMLGEGMDRIREFGKNLGEITQKIINIGSALFDSGAFSTQFNEALSALSPTLGDIWAKLSPLIEKGLQWISENKDAIIAALTGMAIAFGALTIIGGIAALVSALANPLTLIIGLAGLLGVAWQQNWGGIQEKTAAILAWLQPILSQVVEWFQTNIPIALQTLSTIWNTIWGAIQAVVMAVLPIVLNVIRAFQSALKGDWYQFGAYLRQAWDAVWALMAQVIRNAWTAIKGAISSLVQNTISFFKNTNWTQLGKSIIDGMIKGIKSGAGAFANALKNVVEAAVDALKGFLGIHSPSRLMKNEIAGNMMAGWMQGIKERIPHLETMMTLSAGRMAFATQSVQPALQSADMGAVTFYAPVTFRVENGQTMRSVLRELRK